MHGYARLTALSTELLLPEVFESAGKRACAIKDFFWKEYKVYITSARVINNAYSIWIGWLQQSPDRTGSKLHGLPIRILGELPGIFSVVPIYSRKLLLSTIVYGGNASCITHFTSFKIRFLSTYICPFKEEEEFHVVEFFYFNLYEKLIGGKVEWWQISWD